MTVVNLMERVTMNQENSTKALDRKALGEMIAKRLRGQQEPLAAQYKDRKISYFVLDNVLSEEVAAEIAKNFPDEGQMMHNETMRENKYISAQMDQHFPLIEEALFAFQEPDVVQAVADITGLKNLQADPNLYAGGVSLMTKGCFLNPHIDNSHDMNRENYRVLNLLYYVTPDWKEEFGGNLELWPNGTKNEPLQICSKFNRLVVMVTHKRSYHSVSKVQHKTSGRACISNYYFAPKSPTGKNYFHVTKFRGRPEEPLKDIILQADALARRVVRIFKPKGAYKLTHVYEKKR